MMLTPGAEAHRGDARRGCPAAVLAVALVLPTVVTWVYFIALKDAPTPVQHAAYGVGKAIQFGLPIAWVLLVQRERLSRPKAAGSRWLIVGGGFGLVVGGGAAAAYAALSQMGLFGAAASAIRAKVESFGAASPSKYVLLGLFYATTHSLLEEYYWRWFVFGQLVRDYRLTVSIAVSSLAFAAHHVLVLGLFFGWHTAVGVSLTCLLSACVAVGGAFWAWLYYRSGSLYAPWLSHAIVDAALFAIGYAVIAW